jgi:uncharacterized protein with HEPN domain
MKKDSTQIERIFDELNFISEVTKDISLEQFLKNELLQHAVSMSLITIGECANHLSDDFREAHDEIEWIQIIAVRNIAAHGYWQLSMEQIWQAIIEDVPKLKAFVDSIM